MCACRHRHFRKSKKKKKCSHKLTNTYEKFTKKKKKQTNITHNLCVWINKNEKRSKFLEMIFMQRCYLKLSDFLVWRSVSCFWCVCVCVCKVLFAQFPFGILYKNCSSNFKNNSQSPPRSYFSREWKFNHFFFRFVFF